ncbi:PilZ domain-containing protein [Geothrix sp. 21YS21S-4]|uniref:PilZ domain-containing protein n=1 Tax=Geothrix sp. 21YS21S-4 TaxID=3068889 RepID=UPI0027BAC4BD|nr:PilZ domain-containing protein [Geothrix sp. 21YS21S-4]
MISQADRRDARRIIVGAEFAISFTLRGHDYRDVRITNLSPGGCFALVGARDARLFERGAVLEGLVLQHPELPKAPILATVSYVLGGRPGADPLELVGIGIQFQGMDPASQEALDTWVDAAEAAQRN